ncbi:MAG: hypothetical protein C0407_15685, partial [Desulfobacca sp.]|nr:hypothetical protein [Desulfobacca sp.]
EIPLSGRIAFIKARYLSLYTHHQTVIPPYVGPPSLVGPPSEVLACLSQWQVSHVLVDDHFIKEEASLRKTIDQFPGYFSRCYSSPPLTLFQFQVTK